MNIGIDIRPLTSPIRSGVGEYTYALLDAIFTIDKINHYFLFYNSYTDVTQHVRHWQQDNIYYVHKKWPNKLFNFATKFFNAPKIDATIHNSTAYTGHTSAALDYFFSPNFGFTALSKKTNHIITVHDLSFEFFPQFFSKKQRLWHWAINPKQQCQKASVLLCPSENTKRDIITYYEIPAEKIKIIYPGVDCRPQEHITNTGNNQSFERLKNQVRQKYTLPDKFILFLGTIEPRKNILSIVEAFEQVCSLRSTTHYSLVLAGYPGWKNNSVYQKIATSAVRDRIKCIGAIKDTEKSALYALADLFVYPSFYEGFGFPPLEAMACGTPVITSNRSSLPEVSGKAAYLVNPNRPSELAQAMIEMLQNEKLRQHFKNLGLEQAKKFTWDRAAREFLQIVT